MNKNQIALQKIYRQARQLLNDIYGKERTPVFGEGNCSASVMLVGEAPGEQETLMERPFVGKAGKNLDEFLQGISMDRESLYITNVVKVRPYKINPTTGRLSNRPPNKEEIGLCLHILLKEIETIQPQVIVTMGNTPLRALTGEHSIMIGNVHGKQIPGTTLAHGHTLFPLYHPASIIYNRDLRKVYDEDVAALAAFLKENLK